MKLEVLNRKADYIGISGSVLCIIHCMITPILLVSSSFLTNDTVRFGYLSLDYVFIGVNIVAVYFATRHFTTPAIKAGLWFFLSVFAVAILLEEVSETFEYLGYAASLGLVLTHLINIRFHRLRHSH
ncbi:MerC domain-containing protein [Larkinella terrae]|uniref:MerC family mercury resistance protein n=1 Tax=Larkinella terrae TaxID=2025311 RepID=A0A7K0EEV3_9BACT|nr:MerC domain-containing protein [Larkinella terrae]MRS59986.1 MerC family mercury resistance protein [Larkinella terrae]